MNILRMSKNCIMLLIVLTVSCASAKRDEHRGYYDLGLFSVKWVQRQGSTSLTSHKVVKKIKANRSRFHVLENAAFGKDDKSVFCTGELVRGADPASFVADSEGLNARDINRGYVCSSPVKDSHGPSYETVMFNPDVKSVGSLQGAFTKDREYVYYYGTRLGSLTSKQFKVYGRFHARDAYNVMFYYQKNLVMDICDLDSFKADDSTWSNDNSCLYWWGDKVSDIDVKTLTIFGSYAYDKDRVFYNGKALTDVDVETFEAFPGGAKDKFGCMFGESSAECRN